MSFEEAVRLARAIRQRAGWHVLEIGPASGEKLEDDLWGVMAISDLYYRYLNYWTEAGMVEHWPEVAEKLEENFRRRYTNGEH